MKPRREQVSYSRDEGLTLTIEEYSRIRSGVAWTVDKICVLTGHRFCNSALMSWAFDKDIDNSKKLVKVPIGRAEADALSRNRLTWIWLDEG